MSAAIFCPHCKLKYDKAVRLRRHRDFWICSSCAEHYTAETLATACETTLTPNLMGTGRTRNS